MTRITPLLTTLLLCTAPWAGPAARGSAYHGKWELLLANSGDTFQSCMLDLGKSGGKLVWKWGSVQSIAPAQLSVDDKGRLEINKRGWPSPLRLTRLGDAIQGSRQLKNGKVETVTGRLAKWDVDAAGEWSITAGEQGESKGTLTLSAVGAGRYEAKAANNEGHEVDIRSVDVEQNRMVISFTADEGQKALVLRGEIHGDRLVGAIELPDGAQSVPAKGERRRRWGKPVDLLAKGLGGWRPRDPRRKFGWTVTDGVLSNSPPDVDIVSRPEFKDFKVNLEYKVERPKGKRSNSGIYMRGRYEVQILDDWNEDPKKRRVQAHGNGAVYSRIVPGKFASGAPGTWQKYEITLIDRYLTVNLNGVTVVDNRQLEGITGGALFPFESDAGPLMLQGDHGKIEYRNVLVTPALPWGR